MSACDKDCIRSGEPHPECMEHGQVACLRREVNALLVQRTMTVHRLGGMVEGAPTHAGNFLQRIDALREIERAARSLMERVDFWRQAAGLGAAALPGEYDNLRDALAPRPTRR